MEHSAGGIVIGAHLTKIRWSRRVSRDKIRRLYQSDAQGMLDQELLHDVGYGIYVRCQDLLEVSEARRGKVQCRSCGHVIMRQGIAVGLGEDKKEVLRCERCAWQTTWGAYHHSLLGSGLLADGVDRLFAGFVEQWLAAHSPGVKLLLIDNLIHEFHVIQFGFGRPVGVNVIQGSENQVAALIDALAYGPRSTPGLKETRQRWSSRLNAVEKRFTISDLRTIARELGVRGQGRMRKAELIAAIERTDPSRLE